MHQVFISYKAEEFDEANWVRSTLENNGISCWMAPFSIPGGSSYAVEIENAIKNCRVFVLLLSSKSQDSIWVAKELDRAINSGKIIMPFSLENCPLKDDFNFYLTNVQRYDAFVNKSEAIRSMINDINAVVGAKPISEHNVEKPVNNYVADREPKPVTGNALPRDVKPHKKGNSKLWLIIASVVAIIGVVILAVSLSGRDGKAEVPGNPSEGQTVQEVYAMSDNLFDFTFTLEGEVYQLPCSFQKFVDNGWTISDNSFTDETLINGNSYESVEISKNGKSIELEFYNYSGNAKKVKDCKVGGAIFDAYGNASVTIAKNISLQSTTDEILAAFGLPNNQYNYDDYDSLYFEIDESLYNCAVFYCYDDGEYNSIELRNFVKTDDDKTENNDTVPAYLSEYVAPGSVGSDILSGIVMIDGSLYQLPATVQAFVDNGWSVKSQPGGVAAGGSDSMTLQKGGAQIDLSIRNDAKYQTSAVNCIVYSVYAYSGDNVSLSLPGGVSLGMSADQVKQLLPEAFSSDEYSYSISYSYSEYETRDFSISISVDKETSTVSSIKVSNYTWDY